MARSSKPRLGRGISALIGDPVKVPMADTNKIQTNKHDADSVGLSSDNLERVVMVAVGDISTGKHQPRSPIDESTLHDLAASIKSAGVMQPLIARRVSSGRGEGIELIAGERRWRDRRQRDTP